MLKTQQNAVWSMDGRTDRVTYSRVHATKNLFHPTFSRFKGVKMGDVKKISEAIHAIHKQPWNKTSLHKFDPKTRNVIKCSEAVALVANIAKHASLMCSSIGYAADQVWPLRDPFLTR